ncbi:hypothetical protein PRIPAC_97751 [Pristionchus pacificus]|uniref:Uncharacterized protein n=1 Tax=Pristionchus pacificus TaxID=54126 RepID=A0A2A6B386_PRIPA|nr:hypothetical protein PRIPAC_97751 [Pristionchus pacificus]|eukprot:PDM60323.1 hypothetical protein PRIPAC_54148 [Pristionchus pacificus]
MIELVETNPATGTPLAYPTDGEVTCVNGVWMASDGVSALNVQLNPPVRLACSLKDPSEAETTRRGGWFPKCLAAFSTCEARRDA